MKSSLFTFCHLTRKSDQKTCLCRWCPQDQDPRLMLLLKSQNVNALQITAKYYNAKIWPFIVFIDNCVQRNVSSQRHCMSYTWRMIILLFFGTPIISWTHIFLQTQNLQKAEGPHLCCSMHHCTSHICINKWGCGIKVNECNTC